MTTMGLLSVNGWYSRLFTRFKGYRHTGGRRAPQGGPIYFPNHPDEKDPDITPPKLFRIERIKPIKHTTKIQRDILKSFKLDTIGKHVAIVKNIPENNNRLWKVKHLISVQPITFPNGELTKDDIKYSFLKENGECIVAKELLVEEERVKALEKVYDDPKRLDREAIQRRCRLTWLSGWGGGFN